jgi:hypothetical protein
LRDLPERLLAELNDWARLRRVAPEKAAMELMRIGLHAVRERCPDLADVDVTEPGTRH